MRLCILISVACVLTAFGSVQPGPGFDPKEVVQQVHARRDMTDMTLGAAPATLRSGDPGRVTGRPSNRFPELSELGGEQSLDDGEFLIDTSSALVPAPGYQEDPAMAFDGANFLVVWVDHRGDNYSDICGARVTPQGTVLDPSGFVISQAANDQQHPVIGFDGANFLVVWQDYRNGYAFHIYGARVTPGGAVLDPAGLLISRANNERRNPALGFDGANFLVVWQDYRNDVEEPDIYGARLTPGGAVLDPAGLLISQAAYGQYDPALGFDGANFLVVWEDHRSGYSNIYGARVTPAGAVLDPQGIAISQAAGGQYLPALDFDGENFLVVWQNATAGFPPALTIRGARVTPGGDVLDPSGFVITQATNEWYPALDFDGENFLVVWQDFDSSGKAHIYGARVTPGGDVLDPSGFVIAQAPNWQYFPVVGFDGTNFLAAWQDYRNDVQEPDIYGARVTPGGAVLDTSGFVITRAAREQFTPALAFDGANFLVVWEDHRSGYSNIYGARVTPAGAVLDPQGIAISDTAANQMYPALAFDGENFLVTWEDWRSDSDIYGARVTPGGAVLDTDGIVISQASDRQYSPALGFDGANFLVVWEDYRNGYPDVYGARVTPGGAVLDTSGFVISQVPSWQLSPALGFDGANFLVVWQDSRDSGSANIYGARVTPGGAVPDTDGFVISKAVYDQEEPALAFDGADFLVAWEDYRSHTRSDIYGARVTPQGTVLDTNGFVIARAQSDQLAPTLAFDGADFLVVWEDYRSSGNLDIYGAWVAPDGTVSNEGGVVRQAGNQTSLALARGTGSQLFLVYQGWAGTIGDKIYNTDRIWGDMNPNTGMGLEESQQPAIRGYRPMATVVRGVLMMGDRGQKTGDRAGLLDIAGRKVIDLHSGANDVRALAPGVYFVREEPQAASHKPQAVRKVVVQR